MCEAISSAASSLRQALSRRRDISLRLAVATSTALDTSCPWWSPDLHTSQMDWLHEKQYLLRSLVRCKSHFSACRAISRFTFDTISCWIIAPVVLVWIFRLQSLHNDSMQVLQYDDAISIVQFSHAMSFVSEWFGEVARREIMSASGWIRFSDWSKHTGQWMTWLSDRVVAEASFVAQLIHNECPQESLS